MSVPSEVVTNAIAVPLNWSRVGDVRGQSTGLTRLTISGSAGVKGKVGRSSTCVLNAAASTSREYALAAAR